MEQEIFEEESLVRLKYLRRQIEKPDRNVSYELSLSSDHENCREKHLTKIQDKVVRAAIPMEMTTFEKRAKREASVLRFEEDISSTRTDVWTRAAAVESSYDPRKRKEHYLPGLHPVLQESGLTSEKSPVSHHPEMSEEAECAVTRIQQKLPQNKNQKRNSMRCSSETRMNSGSF